MVSRQPAAGFSVVSCRCCYVRLPVSFLRKRQRTAGFLTRKSGSGLPVLLKEGVTARMPRAMADLDRQMTARLEPLDHISRGALAHTDRGADGFQRRPCDQRPVFDERVSIYPLAQLESHLEGAGRECAVRLHLVEPSEQSRAPAGDCFFPRHQPSSRGSKTAFHICALTADSRARVSRTIRCWATLLRRSTFACSSRDRVM